MINTKNGTSNNLCLSIFILLSIMSSLPFNVAHAANLAIVNVDTVTLNKQLQDRPDTVLIDVRTPDEIKQVGTIGVYQNINITRGWIETLIGEQVPDKRTPVIVYCGRNIRSPLAAATLMSMGYTNVKNYKDGYFEWKEAGLDVFIPDKAPDSILYEMPKKLIDGVYTAIGAAQPSTYENSGHNNNISFIITDEAVVVFNAGSSYLIAQSMHEEIKKVTRLPVKYVVLENAQGHAMLGSNYWKQQGAEIVAHEKSAKIIAEQMAPKIVTDENPGVYARYKRRVRDKMQMTKIVMPDRTFKERLNLPVKGRRIELIYFGVSHSLDNIALWMPEEKLLITGDYAFNERLLPILDDTDVRSWLKIWPQIEALGALIVIPGHGDVTDMATVRHFTVDYLEFMLSNITRLIDNGDDLMDAYNIDQSQFMKWKTFRELEKLNAEKLFRKMEFE